jgi:hypothetical protein
MTECFPCRRLITSDVMLAPREDYIIRTPYYDAFESKIKAGKDRLRTEMATSLGTKDGTCAYALLCHMVDRAGFDGDLGESLPYQLVFGLDGMDRWSKGTIRKSVKNLEKLGVLETKRPEGYVFEIFKEANKSLKNKIKFRKVVASRVNLSPTQFGITDKDTEAFETFNIDDYIKEVSAGELDSMRDCHTIVDECDLRGMTQTERARAKMKMYEDLKRSFRSLPEIMPRDKKMKVIEDTTSRLSGMEHIKEAYIAGSFASGKDSGSSDVDVLLVRDTCPGPGNCYKQIYQSPLDVFCFTKEEAASLRERGAVLLSTLKKMK